MSICTNSVARKERRPGRRKVLAIHQSCRSMALGCNFSGQRMCNKLKTKCKTNSRRTMHRCCIVIYLLSGARIRRQVRRARITKRDPRSARPASRPGKKHVLTLSFRGANCARHTAMHSKTSPKCIFSPRVCVARESVTVYFRFTHVEDMQRRRIERWNFFRPNETDGPN